MNRALLFFLLISCLGCSTSFSQTVIINTGTAGTPAYNAGPVYRSSASSAYDASRYAYLYTQSELSAAGIAGGSLITSLGWVKDNAASTNGGGILRIYLKNSTVADYSAASETWVNLSAGTTMVYENTNQQIPATASPNYITFTLNNAFTYTGGSLEVLVEWDINQVTGSPTTGTFEWMWSTVPDRIYGTGQTTLANAGTLSSTTNSISAITDRRPFIQISYTPGTPCINPPTPGIAISDTAGPVCPTSLVNLGLSGNGTGSGITYEWESSPTEVPFTPTSISTASTSPALAINPVTTRWYRAKVVCNSGTPAYSAPVLVTVAGGLPSGTYTINNGSPTTGTNYNSFADAVNALSCGILGPVVFNVVAGSGPYNETVTIPNVLGASVANTITINGNGNIVQYNNTSSERQMLTLSGTKYVKIDSLTFKTLDATYGWGALITNSAEYDSITNCTFDFTTITTTSSANSSGICFSASSTSATSTGNNGSHCYIAGNHLKGPVGSGGPYYGLTLSGASDSNIIHNNHFENYYFYGIYVNGATGSVITDNEMERATKTATTTFYGIYTTGITPGTIISGNRIHSSGGTTINTSVSYGIYLLGDGTAADPIMVSNNIVYNITQGGTIYGIYLSTAPYVKVYHNTVTIDKNLTGTSSNYGIYATGTNTDVEIKNNNISVTGGTEGAKYGFYYVSATSVGDAQRNNVYVNSSQVGNQFYGYYTTAYNDLAAFQAAYPALEMGSVSTDPQFVDALTGNLEPANFLLYANGLNLNAEVPVDINGVTRISTPAPGAFEMAAPPINNAGALALVEPSSAICPGVHPVHVSLINAGLNTLNNVQLHWQVNGVAQSPVTYTGPLDAAIVIGGQNIDTMNIGNVTLTATDPLVVKVWTTMPNGVADTDNSNDTLTFTLVSAMNGTYTVNAANPTSGTNYQTFTDFTNDLLLKGICGPVIANVNAVSGPYEETLSFGNINGSSAANTITVNGNGATVEFNNTSTNRQMLTLSGTRYVKLDSLIFKTLNSTYGWGALITNNSAYDSITRCVFDITSVTGTASASSSGICFSASATSATSTGTNGTNCYIGGNHLKATSGSGGTYYALTIAGASDSNIVENNIFENYYIYGIYINGATGTRVLSNELHRSTKTDVTTFYGIYTTGITPGTKIIGNRIHTPGGTEVGSTSTAYCIYPGGDGLATNRNLVANNVVYDINQGGVIYGIYGLTAEQADIVHNTINLSVAIPNTSTSTVYGIYVSGSDNNTNIRNNNVSITGGTGGTKYGFYYSTATAVADAQRNNFYVNSTQSGTQNYGYLTSAYATLAAFQAAYPALEAGSISEDPEFASVATGNLIPMNTNLFNNGVNLLSLVPVDINGVTRSATPTPGAFELHPSMFNNTGAYELINPSGTFCSGPRVVEVAIINEGINEVTDVEIHWTVNGVLQTTLNYSNTIDHVYSGDNIDTVTLGLANFPAGLPSVVKVWTSLPNGVADSDNENDTITVTVQPSYSVVVDLGNDTNVCQGTNVTLNAGNAGATYLWSDGSTTQTNVINTPGQYYVTVTDNDDCIGSDTLNLTTTLLPVVNLGNDTSICPGSVIILDAGNAGAAFLWDDGSTGQTRDADAAATYSVTVTANGCSASDAINISLIDQPTADGINATYSDLATYFFYPINPQFASTYVWNFGDGSPEVTGNFVQHTYAQNGIYTVTLAMEGICDGAIINIVRTVDVFDAAGGTSINEQEANNQWNLYPNPGRTYLIVENQSGLTIKNAAVYNMAGQKVFSTMGNAPKMTINTENFTSGLYLLKVETKNGWIIRKFEILK